MTTLNQKALEEAVKEGAMPYAHTKRIIQAYLQSVVEQEVDMKSAIEECVKALRRNAGVIV
jgi:hypothetical protein